MLAELSMTSTIRRASCFSHEKNGSVKASINNSMSSSCNNSENK